MPAKQLSPWTMAWFSAAMLFLLLSLGLGLTGAVAPGDWARGGGLAVVHLFTLGWLSLMMMGALIQFVPVLTAQSLAFPRLAPFALLAAISGTVALSGGFLWLDGREEARGLLVFAPGLLGLAFALVGAMIAPPLVARASRTLAEARMVLLALVALVGLWGSGAVMAAGLSGFDLVPGFLPMGLSVHIALGIGGWMSVAAFGVSYKLFPMFLLAPEQGGRLRALVFLAAGASFCAMLVAAMLLVAGFPPEAPIWLLIALLPVTTALYLAEIARIWRLRRRPKPEGNMNWSRVALLFLGMASVLAGPAIWLGGPWAEAAIFVALVGWLSLMTLAQMVKITCFLTWIQIFAPRIGRSPVPQVHQLTDAGGNARWLGLWSAGVVIGASSLLLAVPIAFFLSNALLSLAALGLARELVMIRRLSHLDPALRPTRLPPVILPVPPAEIRP